MLFPIKLTAGFKNPFGSAQGRKKRTRAQGVDVVSEQVKKMLQAADQKIILMVRG